VDRGGLQPDNWDVALVKKLRAVLKLGDGDIGAELDAHRVTAERIIPVLLGELAPFSAMMGELLELFEAHDIKRSDGSAEIVFDFDGEEQSELRFDLEAFRSARRIWERALVPSLDIAWLQENAWQLKNILTEQLKDHDPRHQRVDTAGWIDRYLAGEWPQAPLVIPASGSSALDVQLARVGEIWWAVLDAIRSRAPDREALEAEYASSDPILRGLAQLESDRFLLGLASAALAVATPHERSGDPETLATKLGAFLDQHPFGGEPIQRLLARLLDILDLPIWKRRHELYAAWVLVELLAAAPAPARIVPAEPGVLRFPFAATPMAELLGCEPPVVVWSELRSPLSDPVGVSRTAHVQPDYSVIVNSLERDPLASVLEVECKQYKRADTRAFAAALQDYAAARPNALVVLVSHGPLKRERILAKVPPELRDRTEAVAELQPLNKSARAEFRALVDVQLAPLCPRPALHCRLEWDRAPSDLDLHLWISAGDEQHHVDYRAPGELDQSPFAALSEDVREPGGAEELTIERWIEGADYAIVVHAYSEDGELAGCGARVSITLGGHQPLLLNCPASGSGRWWLVASVDTEHELTVLDKLHASWNG
jgi:hypothetical protein